MATPDGTTLSAISSGSTVSTTPSTVTSTSESTTKNHQTPSRFIKASDNAFCACSCGRQGHTIVIDDNRERKEKEGRERRGGGGDARLVLCDEKDRPIYCNDCVRRRLWRLQEQHALALSARKEAKTWCEESLRFRRREREESSSMEAVLAQWRYRTDVLRKRVDRLRTECSATAIQLASLTVENDEVASEVAQESLVLETAQRHLKGLMETVLVSQDEDDDDDNDEKDRDGDTDFGLPTILSERTRAAQRQRRVLALQGFKMFGLKVEKDRGISKIGGTLPLPNAGPALYGVLPASILESSLRLVASLTLLVAQCLAIPLPHPILLQPTTSSTTTRTDVADTVTLPPNWDKELLCGVFLDSESTGTMNTIAAATREESSSAINSTSTSVAAAATTAVSSAASAFYSASTSSIMSMMAKTSNTPGKSAEAEDSSGSSSFFGFAGARLTRAIVGSTTPTTTTTATREEEASREGVNRREDTISVPQRIQHATLAVIRESSGSSGEYILRAPRRGRNHKTDEKETVNAEESVPPARSWEEQEEEFATGLQLLQSNVMTLCIRAGVALSALHPAEALLLNLDALRQHLSTATAATTT